jgi:hypothetical protein
VLDVPRGLTLLAASLVLASPLPYGASGAVASSPTRVTTGAAAKIMLRGRQGIAGPWRSYLWLKLVRTDIVSFSVCALWDQRLLAPACRSTRGKTLPQGTIMRLEQRRTAGWKRVALSPEAALEAVLSNAVSGNRLGVVSYRVTLRNPTGHIRATSNTFKVFWHK